MPTTAATNTITTTNRSGVSENPLQQRKSLQQPKQQQQQQQQQRQPLQQRQPRRQQRNFGNFDGGILAALDPPKVTRAPSPIVSPNKPLTPSSSPSVGSDAAAAAGDDDSTADSHQKQQQHLVRRRRSSTSSIVPPPLTIVCAKFAGSPLRHDGETGDSNDDDLDDLSSVAMSELSTTSGHKRCLFSSSSFRNSSLHQSDGGLSMPEDSSRPPNHVCSDDLSYPAGDEYSDVDSLSAATVSTANDESEQDKDSEHDVSHESEDIDDDEDDDGEEQESEAESQENSQHDDDDLASFVSDGTEDQSVDVLVGTLESDDDEDCDDEYIPGDSSDTEDEDLDADEELVIESAVLATKSKRTHKSFDKDMTAIVEIMKETHLDDDDGNDDSDDDDALVVAQVVEDDDDDDDTISEPEIEELPQDAKDLTATTNISADAVTKDDAREVARKDDGTGHDNGSYESPRHGSSNVPEEHDDDDDEVSCCTMTSATDHEDLVYSPASRSEGTTSETEDLDNVQATFVVTSDVAALTLDGLGDAEKGSSSNATCVQCSDYDDDEAIHIDENNQNHSGQVMESSGKNIPDKAKPDTKQFIEKRHANSLSESRSNPSQTLRRSRSEGEVRRGKWSAGSKIGVGSFGVVRVGMNMKTGTLMAVKSVQLAPAVMTDIRREIDLLRTLKHVNIVRYLGAEMNETHLHIFQEWVTGGSVTSLLHKFGSFSLHVVRAYLLQIITGLAYLHDKRILHRDIKGGNVLVSDVGIVKLADFGSSKRLAQQQSDMMEKQTMRGTPYFMAPEVFEENYGSPADIWSVGCVAFQMASGSPPWKGMGFTNPMSLFLHIKEHEGPPKLEWDSNEHGLEHFQALLEKCFALDPSKRPSAESLLHHSFFTADVPSSDDDHSRKGIFSPGDESNSTWGSQKSPTNATLSIPNASLSHLNPKVGNDKILSFQSPPLPSRIRPGKFRQEVVSPLPPSPNIDPSEWPSWARGRHEHRFSSVSVSRKDSTSRRDKLVRNLSNNSVGSTMDSLARSEDSSAVSNPFRRQIERSVGSSSSTLDGISILMEGDRN